MLKERNEIKSLIIADKLSPRNLLHAFLDSPILRTRIHIGRLSTDGKTLAAGKQTITIDNCQAKPGDIVITHEII